MILSWHEQIWRRLTARRATLPHSLLFRGRPGTGKQEFARAFAEWLLCEDPTPAGACRRCPSCTWFAQSAHPDFRLLEPEATGERPEAEEPIEERSPERRPRRQIT